MEDQDKALAVLDHVIEMLEQMIAKLDQATRELKESR